MKGWGNILRKDNTWHRKEDREASGAGSDALPGTETDITKQSVISVENESIIRSLLHLLHSLGSLTTLYPLPKLPSWSLT